jgi:hypothetical protein
MSPNHPPGMLGILAIHSSAAITPAAGLACA